MRANEFITEKVIGKLQIGKYTVEIDSHLRDQLYDREARPLMIDYVLRRLHTIANEIDAIDLGQKFWVHADAATTALGFRKQSSSLLLKTVVPDAPWDGPNPILTVN